MPAPIDGEGRILPDPYFGAKDFAIIPKLQSLIQVPVRIENEANAAALAEQRFGVCRGISDFIMIHGNSGISSGLYLANSIYRGNGGLAGGLGHVKVVAKGGHATVAGTVVWRPTCQSTPCLLDCSSSAGICSSFPVLRMLQVAVTGLF